MSGGSSSGGFEGDAVSESFELGDEASGGSFGVAAAEVVAAGFAVELAGLQHVPARAEDRVFDGAERPSVAAALVLISLFGSPTTTTASLVHQGARRGPVSVAFPTNSDAAVATSAARFHAY